MSEELSRRVKESDVEYNDDTFTDEESFIPLSLFISRLSVREDADIEKDVVVEQAHEYDSGDSIEKEVKKSSCKVWALLC